MSAMSRIFSLIVAGAIALASPFASAQSNRGQPAAGAIQIGQGAGLPLWLQLSGACTNNSAGVVTCTLPGTRTQLSGNVTYYISTTGNDSNPGTIGSPWATGQKCWNYIQANIDLARFSATCQYADGTYVQNMSAIGTTVGQTFPGKITFQGNCSTPSNVVIGGASTAAFIADHEAEFAVACMRVVALSGVPLLNATQTGSFINLAGGGAVELGPSGTQAQLLADTGGTIAIQGPYTILTGTSLAHLWATDTGKIITVNAPTVTLSGTPAFTCFAQATDLGYINPTGTTYSGSATGARYCGTTGSQLDTSGSGATFFPGNSAGTLTTGACYDTTCSSIVAAQMPALTGDVTTSAGAVATTIANNAVTNAKSAQMAANGFKGNNTGGASNPIDLTVNQANTLLGTGSVLGGVLKGANFNTTADQPITITSPSTNWVVSFFYVVNPSTSLTTAAGGFYTAASKGGAQVLPSSTVYAALTSNSGTNTSGSMGRFTPNTGSGNGVWETGSTIYFSLTTAQGSAATADIYVFIQPLP